LELDLIKQAWTENQRHHQHTYPMNSDLKTINGRNVTVI